MNGVICTVCYGFLQDHPPGPPCLPVVVGEIQDIRVLRDKYRRLKDHAEELRLFVEGIGDVLAGRTSTMEEIREGLKMGRPLEEG